MGGACVVVGWWWLVEIMCGLRARRSRVRPEKSL